MIFSCVGYESPIVPSMEYDHSFTGKYKKLSIFSTYNKSILCKVISTDSNMHGKR